MNKKTAAQILKLVGDQLKKYYKEIFEGQKNIKLLMDWETFEVIWSKAGENAKKIPNLTQFSYDDCVEIYDSVKTNFKLIDNTPNINDSTTAWQSISLAIAVYQVLIAYDSEDLSDLNSYHRLLKRHYPSLKNETATLYDDYFGKISDYDSTQEQIWKNVSELFEILGKTFDISKIDDTDRFVKYPKSQKILNNREIRRLCNIDFGDVDYLSFSRLVGKFGNYDDYQKSLLFHAYTSYRKNLSPESETFGDSSEKKIKIVPDFRCYWDNDTSSYKIADSCGEEISCKEVVNRRLYAEPKLGCFVSTKNYPNDEIEEVGKIIPESDWQKYETVEPKPTVFNCSCSGSGFKFIVYDVEKIEGTPVYTKFFRNAPEKTEKLYRLSDGLLLDGRSSTYQKDYPPKIEFDFACPSVTLNGALIATTLKNGKKVLDLTDYKYLFRNGNLLIRIPDLNEEIKISFVENWQGTDKKSLTLGWNLAYMEPAKSYESDTLIGLNLKKAKTEPKKSESEGELSEEKVEYEKSDRTFFAKNNYIDCSFFSDLNFSIPTQRLQTSFRSAIRDEIKCNIKDKPRSVYELFVTIANKISPDKPLNFEQWVYFYRLLKLEIFESYKNHAYNNEMVVLYYGGISDSEQNKHTLMPFIGKIPYVEGIYEGAERQQYFKSLKINGWRPIANTSFSLFFEDEKSLPIILTGLCKNLNFECEIAAPVIDYFEYIGIFLKLKKSPEKSAPLKTGGYKITFERDKIATENKIHHIDFTCHRNFEKVEKNISKNIDMTSSTYKGQLLLYDYIQLKGEVTWSQIKDFIEGQIPGENIFDLFFPLYYFGLIDVCRNEKRGTRYFALQVKIQSPFGTIKLGSTNFNKRDDILCPKTYIEPDSGKTSSKEKALKILQKINPVEEIIKNHWIKETDLSTFERLKFVWNFEKIPRDGYSVKKEETFGLMCESNRGDSLARRGAYFVFSADEIYKIPSRNENPNAERLAKIMQRALLNDSSRMSYNKKTKMLKFKFYDVPVPILRALLLAFPNPLDNDGIHKNQKFAQEVSFMINEEIFSELKRIYPKNYICEE